MNDNILIAKFMGWQVLQQEGGWFRAFKPNAKNPTSIKAICGWRDEKDCWLIISQKAQYNKSWDWLIPVIEKIKTLKYKVGLIKYFVPIVHGLGAINQEATYNAVVKLIKWYNKQKKV